MGAVGGRPVKRLPGRHGGEAEDVISPHRNKRDVETSARRKKDDENKAYLERLKLARIQAHEERLALQRKMKSMGGRPDSSVTAAKASTLKLDLRVQDKGDKEVEYLEQLRQARVDAFEARKALVERRGGGGVAVAESGWATVTRVVRPLRRCCERKVRGRLRSRRSTRGDCLRRGGLRTGAPGARGENEKRGRTPKR